MQIVLKYVEVVFLSLLGTDSTDTMISCKTHTQSNHQVRGKNLSEPEPLQTLQKLVILGQVKVIGRQRKETLMTSCMPSIWLSIERRTAIKSLITFLNE